MKELVDYLARTLVDNPDPVQVIETRAPGETLYQLKVGKDDLGKVIGKKGRTAKALRTLLAAVGAKHNMRVNLEIVEPDRDGTATRTHSLADEGGESEVASPDAGPSASEPESA